MATEDETRTTSPPPERLSGVFPDERSWGNVSAVLLRRTVAEVMVPALPDHALLINVGRPYMLEEKLGDRVYRTSGAKGDVAVIPAGVPTEFRSCEQEPQQVESLAVRLDPAFVRKVAEGADVDPDRVELVGILGRRDPAIEHLGLALLAELENDGLLGGLYVDSLATALAVSLLRNHSSLGRSAARKAGREPEHGLPKATLRLVIDYVEENLDRDLTLAEISAVAHLSPFYLSRMFKLSTGYSPHQYVIRRRVERAKRLLTNTRISLHEVAHLCGFADQSHLSKHTRRLLGASPRSLRLASG